MKKGINYEYCKLKYNLKSNDDVDKMFSLENLSYQWSTFSRDFCPLSYLVDNPDVFEQNVNPIYHYIKYGQNEGRMCRSKVEDVVAHSLDGRDFPKAKVAITIHIFYVNYLDSIIHYLKKLNNCNWDLLISCPTGLARTIKARLRVLKNKDVTIFETENVGRNILPFFGLMSDALANYDVIFHLHSKESRYSGRRQLLWSDYLTNSLMCSSEVFNSHVSKIFSKDTSLISPVPFPLIPGWASHVLKNSKFLGELNLTNSGFISYPVGGIFCISGSLYKKISMLCSDKKNFRNEPTMPDGEYHHAIERTVGILAGKNQLFFSPVDYSYSSHDSVLNSEIKRITTPSRELIDAHDVISFDFFDTLFLRKSAWESFAKHSVEQALFNNYQNLRDSAELSCRSRLGINGDPSINDVCVEMIKSGYGSNVSCIAAIKLEQAVDRVNLYPRRDVFELLKYSVGAGKTVYITSDTYYSENFIKDIIFFNGVDTKKLRFLISTATGKRKDYNTVWHSLINNGISKSILHIGDNVVSDIQIPSEHGISVAYVPNWRDLMFVSSGLAASLKSSFGYDPVFCESFGNE